MQNYIVRSVDGIKGSLIEIDFSRLMMVSARGRNLITISKVNSVLTEFNVDKRVHNCYTNDTAEEVYLKVLEDWELYDVSTFRNY